ncbi:MAG: superoxide dismutase family protein [Azoarcus sp.]|jgi:Cu-Zn family superoxide dismutase|nr:superoxide dismutase family protein [Azoarcus sp.]
MQKLLVPFAVSVVAVLLSACAGVDSAPVKTAGKSGSSLQASALLAPTQGNTVQGTVLFRQEADGIRTIAEVSGLTPGSHGFHIHEKGDCSAPDATSAGGHFNPHGTAHGKAGEGAYHAGDLPSLEADAQGNAKLNAVLTGITLTGDHSIVSRGLIVHASPDDYTTQPTGNAGARVACAVIQKD